MKLVDWQTLPPLLQYVAWGCLVCFGLLIASILYVSWMLDVDVLPEPVPPAPSSVEPIRPWLAPENSVPFDAATAMVSRPLLWQERSPPAPAVPPPEPQVPAPPPSRTLDDAVLTGVFLSGDRQGIMLNMAGSARRVMVGQLIDGWKLERVGPSGAVWVNRAGQGEEFVMELQHAGPSPESK